MQCSRLAHLVAGSSPREGGRAEGSLLPTGEAALLLSGSGDFLWRDAEYMLSRSYRVTRGFDPERARQTP
jgi:hypothetical protein